MKRLKEELVYVPTFARVVAGILYLAVAIALPVAISADHNPPEMVMLAALGGLIAGLPVAIFVLLIGYVYGDSKRRGMRHVMWTLLAIFIPNAIGIILYFLMRDPVLAPCRACGTRVTRAWEFCPACGQPLANVCPSCRTRVEPGWANCAHCGTRLSGQEPIPHAAQ